MNLWITLLVEVVIYVIMVFVLGPFWYMYLDDLPNEWYVYRWLVKHFHTDRIGILAWCWAVMLFTLIFALWVPHD